MQQRDAVAKTLSWVPILLILYNFCANLTNDIYLPSLPALEKEFMASSSALQLTMTTWFAGVALPQLFFGPLSDRFGRRPILLMGGVLFLFATLICGLATHVWVLIIARFFQGVGVCSLNVVTFSILVDLYHYKYRTQLMTKINMVGILAPIIGPVVGGYILIYLGWRFNFVIVFMMGFISLLGLWFKLPESNLNLNMKALNLKNMSSTYFHLLWQKGFLRHLLPYCLILGGLIAFLTSAPFIIIEQLKLPTQFFGYTQLPIFGAYIAGSLYLTRVKEEEKIKKLMTQGLLFVFIACSMMFISSYVWGNYLWVFILPMILYGTGFSLCGSSLVNEVMSSAMHAKGSAAAFLGFGMATSCMVSSLMVGLIYNGTIVVIAGFIFLMGLAALSIYYFNRTSFHLETEQ